MPHNTEVVLLHGWAVNHHIFDSLCEILTQDYGISCCPIDLPGHGQTDFDGHFDVIQIADELANRIHGKVHILGWSLGGVVAMVLAARHPHKVASLCLVSTFAKLLSSHDYPIGLTQFTLPKMVSLFQQDYAKHLQQFLSLQVMHAPSRSSDIIRCVSNLLRYGVPPALEPALEAILTVDIRLMLESIECPVLLVFGDKDMITPVRMGQYLHQNLVNSQFEIISGAAHTPFFSHPDIFLQLLLSFWKKFYAATAV